MTAKVTLDGDQLIATRYLDAEPALVWEVVPHVAEDLAVSRAAAGQS